jgi:hypothetical protein
VNSPRPYAIVLLGATTLGVALLAWRQYGELVELRALVMNRNERADLQKRIWELEKLNRELQGRAQPIRPGRAVSDSTVATPRASPPDGAGSLRRGRGDSQLQQMNAMREVLAKPEVQAMIALQQRAGIEARYAALFKNLNLSPDQSARLSALLVERGNTRQDLFSAAREQGIDPRTNPESFRKLLANAQTELDAGIKAVIGDAGLAQLQTYERTLPQRSIVNELQQRLSYTSTPLTSTQSEQLIQILAANAPPRPTDSATSAARPGPGSGPPPPRGPDFGGMFNNMIGGPPGLPPEVIDGALRVAAAPVTPAAVAQAQSVLAPTQLAALQQIQAQQQAQQQLQQIIRDTVLPPPAPGSRRDTPPATPTPGKKRPGGG